MLNIAADLQVHDRTFLGSLKRAASLRGNKPAVRFTDGGDHTALELITQAGRLAGSVRWSGGAARPPRRDFMRQPR